MGESFNRRDFIKSATAAGVGLGFSASPYASFGKVGANDKVNVAILGTNSRGLAHCSSFGKNAHVNIKYICDVDERAIVKGQEAVKEITGKTPKGEKDFRKVLDDQELDVIAIATPDHWHTPAAIMSLQAGKHVYVEKPCGHNPEEGEMLVAAQEKYNKLVQMGNQQRSAPRSIEAIQKIRNGVIGRPYFARAWYHNDRGPIGYGKPADVPSWLDYELWQGPAPRTPYRDNVVHYNWHWFWRWGTGEVLNNGTHEIDVCRWALNVEYPTRVTSTGGRFHYNDDWEFYDTQIVGYEFDDEKSIIWEGKSCNPFGIQGRGRGSLIYGTEGSLLVDRDGYIIYDMDNNEIERNTKGDGGDALNTRGGGSMTDMHVDNFITGIRDNKGLNSPIDEGHKSVLMCHLGNIAQYTGRALFCNTGNGHIIGDREAMQLWSREYESGWEPNV